MISQQPLGSRNLKVSILLLTCVSCRVGLHNGTFSLFKVRELCTGAVKRILGLSSQARNVVTWPAHPSVRFCMHANLTFFNYVSLKPIENIAFQFSEEKAYRLFFWEKNYLFVYQTPLSHKDCPDCRSGIHFIRQSKLPSVTAAWSMSLVKAAMILGVGACRDCHCRDKALTVSLWAFRWPGEFCPIGKGEKRQKVGMGCGHRAVEHDEWLWVLWVSKNVWVVCFGGFFFSTNSMFYLKINE